MLRLGPGGQAQRDTAGPLEVIQIQRLINGMGRSLATAHRDRGYSPSREPIRIKSAVHNIAGRIEANCPGSSLGAQNARLIIGQYKRFILQAAVECHFTLSVGVILYRGGCSAKGGLDLR